MQQLNWKQEGLAQDEMPEQPRPKAAETKIQNISTTGNIKISLKNQPTGRVANAQTQQAAPVATAPTTPVASALSPSSGFSAAPSDFATPSRARNSRLLLLAGGAVGLLALGALVFQFTGGDTAPQARIQASAAETSFAGDLARLVATPASAADDQSAAGQPTTPARAGQTAASEDMMAKMTAGTLAVLRSSASAQGSAAAATAAPETDAAGSELYRMVMKAHEQGQSDAYIDQLLNDAYSRQAITVPVGLIGADGRVDTATILSLFIQK